MILIDGEEELARCGFVTLTTRRLIEEWNHGLKTIMLEQVSSCSIERKTRPLWLRLAAVSLIVGIACTAYLFNKAAVFADRGWQFGSVIAFICVVVYVLSASKNLSIASTGACIKITESGHSMKEFHEFVNAVDAAKARWHLGAV
jgi:hypothetical protein